MCQRKEKGAIDGEGEDEEMKDDVRVPIQDAGYIRWRKVPWVLYENLLLIFVAVVTWRSGAGGQG